MRSAAWPHLFHFVGETMKRTYPIDAVCSVTGQDLIKQIVFHEAGHAAAIYLYNKQKHLPPVYFQITIKRTDYPPVNSMSFANREGGQGPFVAMVEGGSLIHSLPVALIESANYFSPDEQDAYRTAFEADMINLLVGPLAEAKYIALQDDAGFGTNLMNVDTLLDYGGASDLEKVYEYLENFIPDRSLQEQKIAQLVNEAFQFIDSPVYWQAIEYLAGYILNNAKYIISCEEAIAVLDEGTLP
jgi:hypothetical protein